MKKLLFLLLPALVVLLASSGCDDRPKNTTALDEQAKTELNQKDLNALQPAPKISWSLERDNLIKRFKLQNDRSISFYMYVFVEGVGEPIGYYQVNKISSVNSQLTNTEQAVDDPNGTMDAGSVILPSPAEDGSYGTNGDAVFGFTPEDIYIEHNMHYMVSTVPLSFTKPVNRLTIINVKTAAELKAMMAKIR
jgi:hypothetical protein